MASKRHLNPLRLIRNISRIIDVGKASKRSIKVNQPKPVFNTSQNPIVKFSQNAISHPEKTGFSVGVFAEPLPNLIKFPQVLKVSLVTFTALNSKTT